MGRGPAGARRHAPPTARSPRSGSSSGSRPCPRWPSAACVGVGPAGAQVVVVVVVPASGPGRRERLADAEPGRPRPRGRRDRRGRGPGARGRCRSTSGTTPRSTAPRSARWAGGRARRERRRREGPGHRRVGDARRRGRAGAGRPRRRRDGAAAPPQRARACASGSATSPTRRPCAAAVGRRRRGRPPGRQGPRRRRLGGLPRRQRRRHPRPSWTAARAAGARPARPRLLAVGRPRRLLPGRAPAPDRPTPSARAGLQPQQGDGRADRPGRARRRASPSSRCDPTWCGGRATPSWSSGSSSRARAGRLALVGSGTALIDTTYVDNAVDALVAALDHAPTRPVAARTSFSNGEPRPVAEILASICRAAGVPGPRRHVPYRAGLGRGRRRRHRGGRAAAARTTRRSPGSWPSSWPPPTGSTSGAPATRSAGFRGSGSTRASSGSQPSTGNPAHADPRR